MSSKALKGGNQRGEQYEAERLVDGRVGGWG